ncbi:MAG: PIN domain-containing protein, partial [Ilumatobacteraceae bacterium]
MRGGQRTRLVVDTSVLIADPTCVLEFTDADVVVPLTVVEELDGLKSRTDDVGRAARTALRTLEELRVTHGGSLADPVPTGNGTTTLQIE